MDSPMRILKKQWNGAFKDEITPVEITIGKKKMIIDKD
uniref:AbrB/MazE/SpoVT family DNA-binding domain-containing protein n=1 Tax=Ascaris lumbricoides TaxID=6252 RepID=A0A0M3HH37_ASCLU